MKRIKVKGMTVVIPAKGVPLFSKPPKRETPKTVYNRKPKHKKACL
jgi:hypothetical protein